MSKSLPSMSSLSATSERNWGIQYGHLESEFLSKPLIIYCHLRSSYYDCVWNADRAPAVNCIHCRCVERNQKYSPTVDRKFIFLSTETLCSGAFGFGHFSSLRLLILPGVFCRDFLHLLPTHTIMAHFYVLHHPQTSISATLHNTWIHCRYVKENAKETIIPFKSTQFTLLMLTKLRDPVRQYKGVLAVAAFQLG